ncbi:MAG TPA: hypothetical protein VMV94_15430 [Phycisphaerae bacterium]|nr:hypothetical protein [Phycisphaerae bacterium]
MTIRLYKWSKRLLILAAALPVFQTTGTCDLNSIISGAFSEFGAATFGTLVSSATGVLLQTYPSSEMLQILLGGNPFPFFYTG